MDCSNGYNVLQNQIKPERIDSHTYEVDSHTDWTLGPVLHGGSIAAVLHRIAELHLATTLKHLMLPDVHTLHFEFLRFCIASRMRVTVKDLKIGRGSSLLQLTLSQGDNINVIVLATATNFDVSLGPTVEYNSWKQFLPQDISTAMKPDFSKIEHAERDDNWNVIIPVGLLGVGRRTRCLYTKKEFNIDGMVHIWYGFKDEEKIGATHVALLSDMFGSMSDTLLRNNGVFDMHRVQRLADDWASKHPGSTYELKVDPTEAANAEIWNNTLVLDIEFKRRPPKQGYDWILARGTSTSLQKGRLDLKLDLYDQDFRPVALTKQVILVLANERRWKKGKANTSSKISSTSKL